MFNKTLTMLLGAAANMMSGTAEEAALAYANLGKRYHEIKPDLKGRRGKGRGSFKDSKKPILKSWRSKYMPHQGKQEMARRVKQAESLENKRLLN